jgi:hypothetical protein
MLPAIQLGRRMYIFRARYAPSTPKLHSGAHLFTITDCYSNAKWLECAL